MKIIESVEEMREYSQQLKREGKTIASVDTDAELHDGHKTLVKIAKENADVVVLSAGHSVNYKEMTSEKYEKYVADYRQRLDGLSRDIELAKSYGVDVFFYFDANELYVEDLIIPIEMCEKVFDFVKNRTSFLNDTPRLSLVIFAVWAHFPTFKVLMPDISVLGQKDAYRNFGIESVIKQLGLPIKVIIAPILRDSDGIACSSRNVHLIQVERQKATSIYQVLQEVSSWSEPEPINYIKQYITHHIKSPYCFVHICCIKSFKDLDVLDRKAVIIVNAFFGEIELEDNIIIEPK